jgi:hypothetical protein
MIMFIKCDRVSRPWVILRDDWLQRVYVPKRAFPLPLRDMGDVDHIDLCHLIRKLLLPSIIGLPRFILVVTAVLGFSLTLCRYLASLLEHPAVPVSVGCWFFLGTVNPTWAVQESVKLARSVFIPFIGFSFLPGFRSGEPCVDHGVFSIASAIFIPALIFIVLWLSIGVVSF